MEILVEYWAVIYGLLCYYVGIGVGRWIYKRR